MTIIVKKLGYKRKKGMLNFIDKNGNLAQCKPGTKNKKVVVYTRIKKESGYLYFLNKDGHIAKTKMRNSKGNNR